MSTLTLQAPIPPGWSPSAAESAFLTTLRTCFAAVGASDELYDLAVARSPQPGTETLTVALHDIDEGALLFGWSDAAGECGDLAAFGCHVVAVMRCGAGQLPVERARPPSDTF